MSRLCRPDIEWTHLVPKPIEETDIRCKSLSDVGLLPLTLKALSKLDFSSVGQLVDFVEMGPAADWGLHGLGPNRQQEICTVLGELLAAQGPGPPQDPMDALAALANAALTLVSRHARKETQYESMAVVEWHGRRLLRIRWGCPARTRPVIQALRIRDRHFHAAPLSRKGQAFDSVGEVIND